ncbi:MAG: HU family DNA-binding protein [Marinobacter sp.]|uniref:HU family DNA-binding protein n=1 Tax=Marinobacter sp. TaxID=50741 RepID=UPI00299E6651|nr:HU family DNA-binding protein [Marinobacter sp.]MDX1755861.1 HU family DNA-binding protein [Marinobacter sp.]
MNKTQLIDTLITKHQQKRESNQISKADMTAVVDALGEVVQAELASGGDVTLPGIGRLSAAERAGRTGRNPQTGEAIEIPARTVPKFTAGKALKEAVQP